MARRARRAPAVLSARARRVGRADRRAATRRPARGAYDEEIFRSTPRAGVAFLGLADIAYYLIIVAFTFLTVHVDEGGGSVTLPQLQEILASIGALALIIGTLHVFNVLLLPAVGRRLAHLNSVPRGATVE